MGVIAGVIQIAGGGAAPAADADAVPIPHLDMPAQRGVGEAPVRVLVQRGAGLPAVPPAAGDAVQDPGPLRVLGRQHGKLVEHRHREDDLHDSPDAVIASTGPSGAAAGEISQPFFVHSLA